jgi:hypothetical protein
MAAIGTLYLRIPTDLEWHPSTEMAEYFYSLAKHLLDYCVQTCPLRAMKTCSLLAMYNVGLRATVSLSYVGIVVCLMVPRTLW